MKYSYDLCLLALAFSQVEPFTQSQIQRGRLVEQLSTLPHSTLKFKDDTLSVRDGDIGISTTGPASPVSAPEVEVVEESASIPWNTLGSRAVDTVEDILLHLRRKPYDLGWVKKLEIDDEDDRKTVVVLGSGWAANAFLKTANTYKLRVIVVSPVNHFVFTPMLASAAVGTVEFRSIAEPIRSANPMIEQYVQGKAVDVDVGRKILTVQQKPLLEGVKHKGAPTIEIPYDNLLMSVGCKVADTFVKGAAQYALNLKTCDDARKLRNSVLECLEFASRPDVSPKCKGFQALPPNEQVKRLEDRKKRSTFVIVGGGPTGVEVAGEFADLFQQITEPHVGDYPDLKDDLQIILIDGGSRVVSMFNPDLSNYAGQKLKEEGVNLRLNTYVKEIGDGFIKVFPKDGDKDKDEETIECGLVVWAAGLGAQPFTETLLEKLPEEARGPQGRVVVDDWLRPKIANPDLFGSILIMGDAAAYAKKSGVFLPQNAQVAGQQGAFAGRLLNRGFDLTTTPPTIPQTDTSPCATWAKARGLKQAKGFDFLNLGLLAYLGSNESLIQAQLGDFSMFDAFGQIPFILWRSVYLAKQVATKNRVLVSFDWLKTKAFGRDTTRL